MFTSVAWHSMFASPIRQKMLPFLVSKRSSSKMLVGQWICNLKMKPKISLEIFASNCYKARRL